MQSLTKVTEITTKATYIDYLLEIQKQPDKNMLVIRENMLQSKLINLQSTDAVHSVHIQRKNLIVAPDPIIDGNVTPTQACRK